MRGRQHEVYTLLTRGFRFTFAPDCSSTELALGGESMSLWMIDTGDGSRGVVYLTYDGTLTLYASGTVTPLLTGITFERGQVMTLDLCPLAGTAVLDGATSGGGTAVITPWAPFAAGELCPGIGDDPATAFFGRVGLRVIAL